MLITLLLTMFAAIMGLALWLFGILAGVVTLAWLVLPIAFIAVIIIVAGYIWKRWKNRKKGGPNSEQLDQNQQN